MILIISSRQATISQKNIKYATFKSIQNGCHKWLIGCSTLDADFHSGKKRDSALKAFQHSIYPLGQWNAVYSLKFFELPFPQSPL